MEQGQQLCEKQKVLVHLAVFSGNLPEKVQNLIKTEEMAMVLEGNIWQMHLGNYLDHNWNEIFPFITQAACSQLWLNGNVLEDGLYPTNKIIKDIAQTHFLQLQYLDLRDNSITSVESLQFLSMPFLQLLHLSGNFITRLCSMNKCKWEMMKFLTTSIFLFNEKDYNPFECLEVNRMGMAVELNVTKKYFGDDKSWQSLILTLPKTDFDRVELRRNVHSICPSRRQLDSLKEKGLQINYYF